jgi:hypothetical protein
MGVPKAGTDNWPARKMMLSRKKPWINIKHDYKIDHAALIEKKVLVEPLNQTNPHVSRPSTDKMCQHKLPYIIIWRAFFDSKNDKRCKCGNKKKMPCCPDIFQSCF